MTTAYITDTRFDAHTLRGHVESAERLRAVHARLDGEGVSGRMKRLAPEPVSDAQIRRIHTGEYLDLLKWSETQRGVQFGPDTYVLPGSFGVARLSCGGAVRGVEAVLSGEADNALVCTRPPGHHATPDMGMGFCLLANVAIAVRHAQASYGLRRVLIVDYDVHHGNGTQEAFYADPDVLFISTHQYPWYPGTGAVDDIGEGAGRGATINIPVSAGVGDVGYAAAFERVVWPAARRFRPELIVVSAGFDAHWADPLSETRLSLTGYDHLTRELIGMAATLCGGKIVFVLEGGYHLDALSYGVQNVAYALLGDPAPADPLGPARSAEPDIAPLLTRIQQVHDLA
jgi:acetoin utilization deacetylase AcuC-like enzyme